MNPHITVTSSPVVTSVPVVPPVVSVSYARVAALVAQQQHRPPNVSANIQAQTISTFSTTRPVTAPRYTANSAASQGDKAGQRILLLLFLRQILRTLLLIDMLIMVK